MKIKKAVIPIAGKGTRFLPATKEIAKEIIPIINMPMIHHVVLEAVESGIEQIIFVTSSGALHLRLGGVDDLEESEALSGGDVRFEPVVGGVVKAHATDLAVVQLEGARGARFPNVPGRLLAFHGEVRDLEVAGNVLPELQAARRRMLF